MSDRCQLTSCTRNSGGTSTRSSPTQRHWRQFWETLGVQTPGSLYRHPNATSRSQCHPALWVGRVSKMTSATSGDRLGGLTKAVTCTVPSPGHFRESVSQPAAESCGTNRRQGLGLPLILRVPNTQTPGGLSHTAKSVYRSRVLLPPEPPGCRQPQLSSDSAPSLGLGPRGAPWTCCPDRGQQAKMWRATYLVPTRPLHSRLPHPHGACLSHT